MKKLRKLTVALLAAVMLFSLAVPAFASAVPLVDPDLCQFCGIGTYSTTSPQIFKIEVVDNIPCKHGWPGEYDGMLQYFYRYERSCTYRDCICNKNPFKTFTINQGEVCTHEYGGMSLGGELS